MTNEHYLVVSYFILAFASLCLGTMAYRILRRPFAQLVESRFHSATLKRLLSVSLTLAACLGFLSVSYTQKGCINYEQVVKNRSYLVEMNQKQIQATGDWIVYAVFIWGFVMAIYLAAKRRESRRDGNS